MRFCLPLRVLGCVWPSNFQGILGIIRSEVDKMSMVTRSRLVILFLTFYSFFIPFVILIVDTLRTFLEGMLAGFSTYAGECSHDAKHDVIGNDDEHKQTRMSSTNSASSDVEVLPIDGLHITPPTSSRHSNFFSMKVCTRFKDSQQLSQGLLAEL